VGAGNFNVRRTPRMKPLCPVCGEPYRFLDRISRPSMCARCFKTGRRVPNDRLHINDGVYARQDANLGGVLLCSLALIGFGLILFGPNRKGAAASLAKSRAIAGCSTLFAGGVAMLGYGNRKTQ
jgi:hypothetical protein